MKKTSVLHSQRKTRHVNLALIGMSGAGKSYWSKKMEENGYKAAPWVYDMMKDLD